MDQTVAEYADSRMSDNLYIVGFAVSQFARLSVRSYVSALGIVG